MRGWAPALAAALALAIGAHGLHAQVAAGVVVESYSFDEAETAGAATVRLVTVPWAVSTSFRSVVLGVSGAYAEGTATGAAGGEVRLSGPTDTNVVLGYSVRDWLVVTADATLPTGKTTLSNAESVVAGVVAAELLPFSVSSWGSGPRFGGTMAMATQAGPWGIGFSAGYRLASDFEPIPETSIRYDPGDQLQARVGLDRDVGASSTLSLVFGYQHFTDDRVVDANLFRAGSRVEGTVSLAFPLGLRSSALVYGGVNHRSRGTLLLDDSALSGATDSPSQQLFLAGTSARMPLGRRVAVMPRADMRIFRAEDGASQGWVGTVGAAMDLRLVGNSASRRLVLSPAAGARMGNVVVDEGTEVGLTGWELSLSLRVEGG